MSVQFIGMIQPRAQSEIHPGRGEAIDGRYLREVACAHKEAAFDRVLIGWYSNGPDGLLIASLVGQMTRRLGLLVAHRPGFTAPTVAARAFATLDQLTGGRAAIHVISGGDDADQLRDGDTLPKDTRYERTDEYVSILRTLWTSSGPMDHAGRFYQFCGASTEVRNTQRPSIPIFVGGASDAAVQVAGRHADIFALWGETQAQVREITGRVCAQAAQFGRTVGFSLSFRPILAAMEAQAWARAESTRRAVVVSRGEAALGPNTGAPANEGSRRLLDAASRGDRPEGILYTAIARATGARGNTAALVGTPEQVAHALLDYYRLGVSTFLIRGFDPLEDASEYGRDLIPHTRRLIADASAEAGRRRA